MSKPSNTIVICDAGPVLHLDELECLYLLQDFQQVILPETVSKELQRLRPALINAHIVAFDTLSAPLAVNYELRILCQVFALHAGEIEALSLMERHPAAIFLTDDSAARLVAQRMGYKVHGTIGVLLRAIRRQQLAPQDVVNILQTIPSKSSLHLKPALLEDILLQINKEYHL